MAEQYYLYDCDTNSSSRVLGPILPCCVPGVSECGAKCGDRLGDFAFPVACASATSEVPISTAPLHDPRLGGPHIEPSVSEECFLLELLSGKDNKVA